ncbi:hypothetical protein T492DRAFT_1146329 [Pavlovales sp. CCMP2436]|nr:hypothetical protein T492DRAFT_1146329 [Pavlovales sp. CCMP2436]
MAASTSRYPAGYDLAKEPLTWPQTFTTYSLVAGRKRALALSAALLRRHAEHAGLPILSEQDAKVLALRVAGPTYLEPWYLEDGTRMSSHSEAWLVQSLPSLPVGDRGAALAFAARALARSPTSVASWLCAADERVDPVTGDDRTSTATREAACSALFAARGELHSHVEHQVAVLDGEGALQAVCAFSAPPHPALAELSLGDLLSSRLLHAKDEISKKYPGGPSIVERFEQVVRFEEELRQRVVRSSDPCILLTSLAHTARPAPEQGGETRVSRGIELFLGAVQERAEASGLGLLALVADSSSVDLLSRHGFEVLETSAIEGSNCPVTWTTLSFVRAPLGSSAPAGDDSAATK